MIAKKQSKSNHPYLIRVGRGEEGGGVQNLYAIEQTIIRLLTQSNNMDWNRSDKRETNDSAPIPS